MAGHGSKTVILAALIGNGQGPPRKGSNLGKLSSVRRGRRLARKPVLAHRVVDCPQGLRRKKTAVAVRLSVIMKIYGRLGNGDGEFGIVASRPSAYDRGQHGGKEPLM